MKFTETQFFNITFYNSFGKIINLISGNTEEHFNTVKNLLTDSELALHSFIEVKEFDENFQVIGTYNLGD